jgi:hypothetical protein
MCPMANPQIQGLIDAWKDADRQASNAEKLVMEASFQYMNKTGPRPTDEMVGDARLMRSLANQRLERVVALMKQASTPNQQT